MILPIAFKDGNIIRFSTPRLEVDAALEAILLEGLHDHTFGIDLCRENQIELQVTINKLWRLESS